jgi:hypothetical protein
MDERSEDEWRAALCSPNALIWVFAVPMALAAMSFQETDRSGQIQSLFRFLIGPIGRSNISGQ